MLLFGYHVETHSVAVFATLVTTKTSKNVFLHDHIETHCPTCALSGLDQRPAHANVFLYGRGTENRTLINWLKASYFSR